MKHSSKDGSTRLPAEIEIPRDVALILELGRNVRVAHLSERLRTHPIRRGYK
jgi:hypothetical protein